MLAMVATVITASSYVTGALLVMMLQKCDITGSYILDWAKKPLLKACLQSWSFLQAAQLNRLTQLDILALHQSGSKH